MIRFVLAVLVVAALAGCASTTPMDKYELMKRQQQMEQAAKQPSLYD